MAEDGAREAARKTAMPFQGGEPTPSDGSGSQGPKAWYTIGELAAEFEVTLRALRFYEAKGLLAPYRDGTTRLYARRDRVRLKLILTGKRIGLSLMEIRQLLEAYSKRDGGRRQMVLAKAQFTRQAAILTEQRAEIDAALAELEEHLTCLRRRLGEA